MLLCALSSGSGGNCTYVEGGGAGVLVDCGLSLRGLKRRMAAAGLPLDRLRAIFVTHEHGDHCAGASQIARGLDLPIYASAGTLRALDLPDTVRAWPITREGLDLGGLLALPVPLPHDATEPTAFVFEAGGRRSAVVTDLGHATRQVVSALSELDLLLLEFNHDESMLREGPYPLSLQRRIKGGLGHLSNVRAAELLDLIVTPRLRGLVLAHLSETNNKPALAAEIAESALRRNAARAKLIIAEQMRPTAKLAA